MSLVKPLDVLRVREDFPILNSLMQGKPLVYLDNAATTQKPTAVIEAMNRYYREANSNIHRGAYTLSQHTTDEYESVREKIAQWMGAKSSQEIVFTRGTTESVNLVASSWGRQCIQEGDDIVVTRMEHHSNFVPWQQLAIEKRANFKIVELTGDFRLDRGSLESALSGRPRVLAITLMSNVLGTINGVREAAELAHRKGARVVVDAAQAVAHMPVRISDLGPVDFVAWSGHKVFGPTGIGVLWGRSELLETMPPYQLGGGMILHVEDDRTSWNEIPWKFEAGTPHIAGVIGLGAAVEYVESIGFQRIEEYERDLTQYALHALSQISSLRVIGPTEGMHRGAVVSFVVDGIHPHDLSTYLDHHGIAVRSGHHCTHPLGRKMGVPATTRASFSFYNTHKEIDLLVSSIKSASEFFSSRGGKKRV